MTDLHLHPPMTLGRVRAGHGWLLPTAAVVFVLLTMGAIFDTLPWDRPITDAAVDARTPWLDDLARRVSFLGSTPVVVAVAGAAALVAWRRCPRLALAIVVVAAARPLAEFGLKELIGRERPAGDRLVDGTGPSFPSGHVLATAASWGLVPLVAALYTRRRPGGPSPSAPGPWPCWSRPPACGSASTGPRTSSPVCCWRCWASPPPSGSSPPATAATAPAPARPSGETPRRRVRQQPSLK